MAEKFTFLDILNNSRTQGAAAGVTEEYTEIYLDPRSVKEAPRNTRQEYNGIEELADSFLIVGQEQPTVLARIGGEYYIVDGHRRNRANILNIERGFREYEKVKFFYKDMSETIYELALLSGNGYTQDLTPYEKMELAARLQAALKKARESGEIPKEGKVRDLVGKILGEEPAEMGRIMKINKSLTEEAREEFRRGTLNKSAAYETARLPEEDQREIAERVAAGEKIRVEEIKALVKEKEEAKEAARQAKEAAKRAQEMAVTAAQGALSAERAAENADTSADITKKELEKVSNLDIQTYPESQENTGLDEQKELAINILRSLLTVAQYLTTDDLCILQDILIAADQRAEK